MLVRGKKGLSKVVSTVLIILIAVCAVAIITILIINSVRNLKINADTNAICGKVEVVALQCLYNDTDAYGKFSVSLPDGVTLANLSLAIDKSDSNTYIKNIQGNELENYELSSFLYNDPTNKNNKPTAMSVVPYVIVSNKLMSCSRSNKINCNLPPQTYVPPVGNITIPGASKPTYTTSGGGGGGSGGGLHKVVYTTLTITKSGTGEGKVVSATGSIDCGSTCSANIAKGNLVNLTAIPNVTSIFGGWTNGPCNGSVNKNCVFNIDANINIAANFVLLTGVCSGNPTCSAFNARPALGFTSDPQGCSIFGCNYDSATDVCSGTAKSCSDVATNEIDCNGWLAYCTWIGPGGEKPATPTGLTAIAASDNQINLAWNAVAGVDSYNIYRATLSGNETIAKNFIASNSYTNLGLTPGTKYYYKVSAVKNGVESDLSNEASATTSIIPVTNCQTTITNGLVGFYCFENDFKDGSGKSNDASGYGSASFDTLTNGNHAVKLNGVNSYVERENVVGLGNPNSQVGSFSYSFWMKRATSVWEEAMVTTLFNDSLQFYMNDNYMNVFLMTDNGVKRSGLIGGGNTDDTLWHNYIVTFSGDGRDVTTLLYKDSALIGQDSAGDAASVDSISKRLLIGKGMFGLNFNGDIDDVMIYSRSISAFEAITLYNEQKSKFASVSNSIATPTVFTLGEETGGYPDTPGQANVYWTDNSNNEEGFGLEVQDIGTGQWRAAVPYDKMLPGYYNLDPKTGQDNVLIDLAYCTPTETSNNYRIYAYNGTTKSASSNEYYVGCTKYQ